MSQSPQERVAQCERLVRRLRNDPRLWDEDDRVHALLGRALKRQRRARERVAVPEPRGPYSGMTPRELAASGTCEPDWF